MNHLVRTPSQLSSVLKSVRQARRQTQVEVGAKVGLRQKTVSLIETDAMRTGVGSLFRLLSALDLELVVRAKKSSASDTEW